MSSCFSSSRIKQRLAEKDNIWIILLIASCYITGVVLSFIGLTELYKTKTFAIHQCQIKAIDLKFDNGKLYPRWNITVVYENKTINNSLMGSSGLTSERDAWIEADKYKINKTYSCYHSQYGPSIIPWGLQWKKPSELEVYTYLFGGITSLLIGTALLLLRRYYQAKFLFIPEQQQELEPSSQREEQLEITTPLENPPPTYDEAVQWIGRIETT